MLFYFPAFKMGTPGKLNSMIFVLREVNTKRTSEKRLDNQFNYE
jgi:hypothetical protein